MGSRLERDDKGGGGLLGEVHLGLYIMSMSHMKQPQFCDIPWVETTFTPAADEFMSEGHECRV